MITQEITVTDPEGMHLRPAGLFSKIARNFDCETTIVFEEKEINAKKMMAIMSAGITAGAKLKLVASGENEETAIREMTAFFNN